VVTSCETAGHPGARMVPEYTRTASDHITPGGLSVVFFGWPLAAGAPAPGLRREVRLFGFTCGSVQ
jgi:hypothetical protein